MASARLTHLKHGVAVIPHALLNILRILTASATLAMAASQVLVPQSPVLFDATLLGIIAQFSGPAFLAVTGLAMMFGVLVRPAALLLTIYAIAAAIAEYNATGMHGAYPALWANVAHISAVIMIALTSPAPGLVSPRRVAQPDAPRRARPKRKEPPASPFAGLNGDVLPPEQDHLFTDLDEDYEDEDPGEMINLFADLWDHAPAPAHA